MNAGLCRRRCSAHDKPKKMVTVIKKGTRPVYFTPNWSRHQWTAENQTYQDLSALERNHPQKIWTQSIHNIWQGVENWHFSSALTNAINMSTPCRADIDELIWNKDVMKKPSRAKTRDILPREAQVQNFRLTWKGKRWDFNYLERQKWLNLLVTRGKTLGKKSLTGGVRHLVFIELNTALQDRHHITKFTFFIRTTIVKNQCFTIKKCFKTHIRQSRISKIFRG